MALPARLEVYQRLRKLRRERPLHLTLLDPGKSDTTTIGRMARGAAEAGTDVIMVGGSTGLSLERVDTAVVEIKEQSHLPVILFPTVAKAVSTKADAIFFMSLLNSSERRFLVGEQIESAAMVHQSGLQVMRRRPSQHEVTPLQRTALLQLVERLLDHLLRQPQLDRQLLRGPRAAITQIGAD